MNTRELIKQAVSKSTARDYAGAIELWGEVIVLTPKDSKAYQARALDYESLNRYSEALADCNKAIELAPDQYIYYIQRASCHLILGNKEAGLNDFRKAIELNPKAPSTYINLADWEYEGKNYEDALKNYTAAIDVMESSFYNMNDNQNACRAYLFRGNTHMALGRFQEAVEDYTMALTYQLRPGMKLRPSTFIKRAAAFEKLGKPDLAKEDYKTSLDLRPTKAENIAVQERLKYIYEELDAIKARYAKDTRKS